MLDRIISSKELKEELEKAPKQKGFSTGYEKLDGFLNEIREGDLIIISGITGEGKCLGKGTPILMFDGTIKAVEKIKIGDELMGDDSTPRKVLSLGRGKDMLFKIIPHKGDSFIINSSHILTLKKTGSASHGKSKPKGQIIDIPFGDFIQKSFGWKWKQKLFKVPVNFQYKKLPLDPYFLGIWLGDGDSDDTVITTADQEIIYYLFSLCEKLKLRPSIYIDKRGNKAIRVGLVNKKNEKNPLREILRNLNIFNNKHIPLLFKASNREQRLELLAGLIDSDGYKNRSGYVFVNKNKTLATDAMFVARSLGFESRIKPFQVERKETTYYKVSINGNGFLLPLKIERKKTYQRKQKKDILVSGFSYKPIGWGNYYGFTLDGNGRFLLGDFTVTHNTAFGVSLTKNFIEQKLNCLWFSYEISSQELLERFGAEVPVFYLPRLITSRAIEWIERKILEGKKQYDTKIIFIDHLHYLTDDSSVRNRNLPEILGHLCRQFKLLAKRHRLIIFLVAHTRKVRGNNKRPTLDDLKDSSGIAQEADTILIIQRKGKRRSAKADEDNLFDFSTDVRVWVEKSRRTGRLGVIDMMFDTENLLHKEYE